MFWYRGTYPSTRLFIFCPPFIIHLFLLSLAVRRNRNFKKILRKLGVNKKQWKKCRREKKTQKNQDKMQLVTRYDIRHFILNPLYKLWSNWFCGPHTRTDYTHIMEAHQFPQFQRVSLLRRWSNIHRWRE